jgi:hypothetical protein
MKQTQSHLAKDEDPATQPTSALDPSLVAGNQPAATARTVRITAGAKPRTSYLYHRLSGALPYRIAT